MIFDLIADLFRRESDHRPLSHFGRYSDAFKTAKQRFHWNEAKELFRNKAYLDAYEKFFLYLSDEKEQNVQFERSADSLSFSIFQGSKRMTGFADNSHFRILAKVAKYNTLNVAIMRKLLERNYALRYSSFCLTDNDEIAMRFETSTIDGSPEKLYSALKEVAIHSDKDDDLLLNEFPLLEAVENQHLQAFSDEELGIKCQFMRQWINHSLELLSTMSVEKGKLPASYLLLSLAYKIDYLVVPQGNIMDMLEKVHQVCGLNPKHTDRQTITDLKKRFQKIQAMPDEKVAKELYRVTATFGVSPPTEHAVIAGEILDQIAIVRMYHDHQEEHLAVAHLEYITMRMFFRYGFSRPTRELLDLIVEVLNCDYWKALGLRANLIDEKGNLQKSNIGKRIKYIQSQARVKYPAFEVDSSILHYANRVEFCESLLQQIRKINYNIPNS